MERIQMVRFDVVMDEILDGLEERHLALAIEECEALREEESAEGAALLDALDEAGLARWPVIEEAHKMGLCNQYGDWVADSWEGYWKHFPESAYVLRRLDAANAAYNAAIEAYHAWQRQAMFNQVCRNAWIESLSV